MCSFLKDESNRTLYGKYLKENPDPEVGFGSSLHGRTWSPLLYTGLRD